MKKIPAGGFYALVVCMGMNIAAQELPAPPDGAGFRPQHREANNMFNGRNERPPEGPPRFFQRPAIVFHIVTRVFEAGERPASAADGEELPADGEKSQADGAAPEAGGAANTGSKTDEVWEKTIDKIVLPGEPVNIKLAGKNIAVAVQFTPYLKYRALVAQQQIWFQDAEGKLRYETAIQTVPLRFNRDIYYFPLGQERKGNDYFMEITLNITPYKDNPKN